MMRIAAAVLLLALLCAGGWLLFFHEEEVPLEEIRETLAQGRSVSYDASFEEGMLTLSGTIATLDACERATATATLVGESHVRVDISVPGTEGPCLARQGSTGFSTSLAAPEDASLEFLVNGTPAVLAP